MTIRNPGQMFSPKSVTIARKIPRIWALTASAHTARIFKRDGERLETIAGMQSAPGDFHDNDGKGFASEIASWLDNALRNDSYDRLVLIAAPGMLGNLRHAIGRNVLDRIVAEVDKDLTKMPEHELQAELARIVWF